MQQELIDAFRQFSEASMAVVRAMERQKNDPETRLIAEHGEVVNKKTARVILGIGHEKVTAMLEDGRLQPACEGAMISVASIARYIDNKKKMDWDAKIVKRRKATKTPTRGSTLSAGNVKHSPVV